MTKLRTLFLFLAVAATVPAVFAQSATFEWQDEFCTFRGTYDPSKISEARIRDTRELIDFGTGLPLQTDQAVFDVKDLGSLDVNKLDAEYRTVRTKLESLQPVDNPYFRDLRQRHLRTLDASYRLKRITLLAHTKPITLVFGNNHEECFSQWGRPVIEGGQSLLDAWRTLVDEQKLNNASPEGVEARYQSRYNSPERDKWALVEVLGFGWWNCVNDSIPYVEDDGTADEEFKKLFAKVESECDEP
ncbi:MAG: hypothetical protein IPM63_07785 [Acidobacteriota bacterium]|nr:MAG: hypothetical protein IPM63_07785 [Acidobacteriota bacterium]